MKWIYDSAQADKFEHEEQCDSWVRWFFQVTVLIHVRMLNWKSFKLYANYTHGLHNKYL